MDESSLIPVGKAVKTHGVRGALKVRPYGETLGEMEAGEKLFFIENGVQLQLTIVSLRAQRQGWIAQFEEIENIDRAEALTGKEIFIDKDRLPELPEGEYYHFQLIGLSVETKEGEPLGTLSAIFETGGNEVYVVESAEKELLIPAIEDVICEVDLQSRKLIVDLPEGLQ
jgi:16S rRNA processing protein RimM